MNFDVKHFVLSHLIWIVGLLVALILGHSWLVEHDQRLLADQAVKTAEAQVKDLQAQIAANNAAAAQKVQVVTKIVHDVKTPEQAVQAVPQLTDVPLHTRVAPDNPTQVAVDALPLIDLLGQAKIDKINLDTCQANLATEIKIVDAKDVEIKALKKKPGFWGRVGGVAKAVGVGIGIGVLIAGHV